MPVDTFILGLHDVVALALGVAACGVSVLFAWLAPWSRRDRRPRAKR